MTPALVLSGGGSKGAFEVGALEYLSRGSDFLPRIMAGTSVGSLVCGPLAQATSPAEFRQLVEVVRGNALAVSGMNTVFGRQPWLDEINGTPLGDFISDLISVRSRPPLPPDPVGVHDPLAIQDPPRKHRTLFAIGSAIGNSSALVRASKLLREAGSSVMNLDPMEAGFRGDFDGGVARVDEPTIASSGVTLRISVASLRDGVARYVTEDGSMVMEDSVTPYEPAGNPGVIQGMCTSSSVPIVFPPRRIGDDVYVDGGIVQNIPLRAAVECGADDVIVILTGPLATNKDDTDFTQASLISVFTRSASDITPQQLSRENLRFPLVDGAKLTVIEPTAEVLGGFEMEAGLIEIDFSYGWLRAAETLADITEAERCLLAKVSDDIVLQRERAWFAEERILATGPQLNLVGALRRSREHVVASVTEWQEFGLPQPQGISTWGKSWEQHQIEVPTEYQDLAQP